MKHIITVFFLFCACLSAQPSLTNTNLDGLTATAKTNLETLGMVSDDGTNLTAAIEADPAASKDAIDAVALTKVEGIFGEPFPGEDLYMPGATQWYLDGSAISGETSETYTIDATDIGGEITALAKGVLSDPVRVWHPNEIPEVAAVYLAHDGPLTSSSPSTDADTVDTWTDLSPNGYDLSAGATTPTYDEDGGGSYPSITFDGSTDKFEDGTNGLMRAKGYGYIIAGCKDTNQGGGGSNHSVALIKTSTGTSRFAIHTKISAASDDEGLWARTLIADSLTTSSSSFSTGFHVRTAVAKFAEGTTSYRVDGVEADSDSLESTGTTDDSDSTGIVVGAGSNFLPGDITAVIIVSADADISARDLNRLERYVGLTCGVTIAKTAGDAFRYEIEAGNYSHSAENTYKDGRIQGTTHSGLIFKTAATSADIYMHGTSSAMELGVFENGVHQSTESVDGTVGTAHTVTLSSGDKIVEFRLGYQGLATPTTTQPANGTFVRAIEFNSHATPLRDDRECDLLVYGDSIVTGSSATDRITDSWIAQVKAAGYNVRALAWGGRALYSDCDDLAGRQATARLIAQSRPKRVWIALGVNDYAYADWNHTDFGTAYASLLDEIHNLLPSAEIFAQSPIIKTSDGANGQGSTLANYRSEISTAAAARTSFCTFVDGTAILTSGELSGDGIHPNDDGHDLIATEVLSNL